MGSGKSSGNQSTTPSITPQQTETLNLQNAALANLIPTYLNTVGGATNVYNQETPNLNSAATNATQAANAVGQTQYNTGTSALNAGMQGLQSLFSPQYEQQQVMGALAPAEFQAQQANVGSNAGFAGAGEAGSARNALANQATQALQQQMFGSTAANVESGITAGRQSAANSLAQLGTQNLSAAPSTYAGTINYAQSPTDLFNAYASTIFGVPGNATTPNYAGTQGSTSTGHGKSSGINISDIRLKRFVHVMDYGLSEVKKLIPVSWLWKDTQKHGTQKEIGFIAQDVQELIPEAVHKIDGYLGIDYPRLTAVLVNAIKQQQVQIDELSKQMEEMKNELHA